MMRTLFAWLFPAVFGETAPSYGGIQQTHLVSAATTNATLVKNAPGMVYEMSFFNTNAAARYVKVFDKATAPVPGTDTPVRTMMAPGSANGAGFVLSFPNGLQFQNGIGFALTGAIADNDTTAIGANDCVVNFGYR